LGFGALYLPFICWRGRAKGAGGAGGNREKGRRGEEGKRGRLVNGQPSILTPQ